MPERLYQEEILAFKAATELLLKYMAGWVYTKDNPEVVKEDKDKYIKKYGFPPSY